MTWRKITCEEREVLIDRYGRSYNGFSQESGIGVYSGVTDLSGTRTGRPYICTVWAWRDSDIPVLKDERWPESSRQCEHHEWVEPA